MAPALAGLARRVQPDVVHSHYLLPYGYWAARAGLGPLVVSPWGKDAIVDAWQSPEGEERARVAIAPERARAYVVNSQALEDAAVRLGADRAKFHRIFWHARIDGYSPEHADRSRWSALGWPDDAVVCLSLRNFRPYSNLDVVLRSFAKAREEVPELRLFSSAGGGWTREEFDRLAAELGVEPYMAVQDVPAAELRTPVPLLSTTPAVRPLNVIVPDEVRPVRLVSVPAIVLLPVIVMPPAVVLMLPPAAIVPTTVALPASACV